MTDSSGNRPDNREPLDVATLMANADSLVGRDIDVKGTLLFEAGEAFFVPDQAVAEAILAKTSRNMANNGVCYLEASDLAGLVHVGEVDLLLAIQWKLLSGNRFGARFEKEFTARVEGTLTRDAGVLRIARPRRLRFWSRWPDNSGACLGTMHPAAGNRFSPSPATRAEMAAWREEDGRTQTPRMSKRWARPWTITDAEWQAVVDALPGKRNRTRIDEAGNHPDDREPLDVAALIAVGDSLVGRHVDVKGWLVSGVGAPVLIPDEAAMDAIHAIIAADPISQGGRGLAQSDLTHLVHVGDEDLAIAINWKVRIPILYGTQISMHCTARIDGELTRENGILGIPRPRRLRFWHRRRSEETTTFHGTLFPAARNRYVPSAFRRDQMADALWDNDLKHLPRMPKNWGRVGLERPRA